MSAPTLPSFMERALAFFGKAEANHTAETLLATANARIVTLESEIATLKAASGGFEATITTLTGDVASAKAALATKEDELKNVQAELVTAKGTANAVIASQGLAASALPPLEPRPGAASATHDSAGKPITLTERCLAEHAKAGGNGNGNGRAN